MQPLQYLLVIERVYTTFCHLQNVVLVCEFGVYVQPSHIHPLEIGSAHLCLASVPAKLIARSFVHIFAHQSYEGPMARLPVILSSKPFHNKLFHLSRGEFVVLDCSRMASRILARGRLSNGIK